MTYNIGSLAHLEVFFTDISGNPADPGGVVLTVMAPNGTSSTPGPIIRTGVGAYYCDLPVALSGVYNYEWDGTGAIQAVAPGSILVAKSILVPPSPIDLVTVEMVTQWIPVSELSDLANLQVCITSASTYWLWRTGLGSADGGVPTTSPLKVPVVLDEWYDGAGGLRQFVRVRPIQSVQGVTINGIAIPASSGPNVLGYVIDQNRASVVIRQAGGGSGWPMRAMGNGYRGYGYVGGFASGFQNVNVKYTAGFIQTPMDIVEKVIEMVVLNFKRRDWVDQASNSKPETIGAVTYRKWELTPGIESVMENYSRRAIV